MAEAISLESRVRRLLRRLSTMYPDAACSLEFENPLQLLVATILSAQCTDVRVNQVTPALFARFPTPEAFADCDISELEDLIRSTGFFRNKAKNIKLCCQQIVERHSGQVPGTLEELVKLAGIGRKTANVILGDAFRTPGITVDTHVGRLSRRLGLTEETNPVKAERDLMKIIPRRQWTTFSHRMIFHGRQICHSRKPKCDTCPLANICPKIGIGDKKPSKPKKKTTP